jgi:hypothetical protein
MTKISINLSEQNTKIVRYLLVIYDPSLRREIDIFFDNIQDLNSYIASVKSKNLDLKIYKIKYKIEQMQQQELTNEFGQNSFDPFRL